jgi:hypothetical protein
MKSRSALPWKVDDDARHEVFPTGRIRITPDLRTHHSRLSPITAIVVAAAGMALGFGAENDHFGCQLEEAKTLVPAEVADISLKRRMVSRITGRIAREGLLNNSITRNAVVIDNELRKVRGHPLYVTIKEMITNHLRTEGYERVPVTNTAAPESAILSADAATSLYTFIHSLRVSLTASNERLETFLKVHEKTFGASTVTHCGAGRYVVSFPFLIQLLCEFPDDLEPSASKIRFLPLPPEEIERRLRGDAQRLH